MELKFVLFSAVVLLYFLIFGVMGDDSANKTSERRKSRDVAPYMGLISCAVKYDVTCFVNAAEDFLEVRRTELLAEADAQVVQSGRASDSSENKPSHIANTLSRLISELTSMFQNGLSGFFKAGEDDLEEDEDEEPQKESDNSELTTTTDQSNGEGRSKKKKQKKKLYSLLKILAVGLVIYKKICLLFKLFHAALQLKIFFLAIAGLTFQAIKFWLSFKKDAHPTKVIYYEHAQHQHHYGHGDDEGHSIWGRALHGDGNGTLTSADLAYSKQRPYYVVEFAS